MKILMRSLLSLAIMLFLLPQSMSAQTISEGQAMENARNFLNVSAANRMPSVNGGGTNASSALSLAYQAQSGENTAYYVFNIGQDDGFVIAGGDEVAKEILAYAPQGHFDYENIPDNVKSMLSYYNDEIGYATRVRAANNPQIGDDCYISYQRVNIPDLITTKWHQGYPYNAAIPSSDPQIKYPAGCTATAIAQIMNYWKYPQSGIGSKSYTDWNGNDIFADFEQTTYDWANMLDSYDENATQTQIDAVATLTYHVGASLNTQYGQDGSSTQLGHTNLYPVGPEVPTFVETFGYDNNIISVGRAHYSTKEWERLIYDELILGRPVLYISCPEDEAGHEFIIHGHYCPVKI